VKRILVVSAHPDDEMLGCGGTLAKEIRRGSIVEILILGQGMMARNSSESDLEKLRKDSLKANEFLGVNRVEFHDFPDNAFDTVRFLDIVRVVERKIKEFSPDIVLTHHGDDLNVDHRLTFEAVLTACRPMPDFKHPDIYTFFIPSSTDWIDGSHFKSFSPNLYVDISDTIELKLRALEFYETEMREYPHSRSVESLRIFSKYWGNRVGVEYAEPFHLVRSVRDEL